MFADYHHYHRKGSLGVGGAGGPWWLVIVIPFCVLAIVIGLVIFLK